MAAYCTRCAADVELVTDESSGFSCCSSCGCVLEENNFSSDLMFAKGPDGEGGMVGTIVGQATGGSKYSRGAYAGGEMEGHESSAARGHQEMSAIADHFHLTYNVTESAYRLYKLALQHGFTRGRRVNQVAATCLYIVCRQDKLPYMLIDFSDYLSVNVYSLGAVYLQLLRLFRLEDYPAFTKPTDPSLYLHRFAERMRFPSRDETRKVEQTALHLVQSMKRDWMQTGRKPSGICGAALFIAAHIHGYERTKQEIIGVVHIGWSTIEKRVKEFANTATSLLTHSEFADMSSTIRSEHLVMIREIDVRAEAAAIAGADGGAAPAAALPCTVEEAAVAGGSDACGADAQPGGMAGALAPPLSKACEHVVAGVPALAHGMCRVCFVEYLDTSGGIYLGTSDPPAYLRNLRAEVRAEMLAQSAGEAEAPVAALPAPDGAGMDEEAAEFEAALAMDGMARLSDALAGGGAAKGDTGVAKAGGMNGSGMSGSGGAGGAPPAGVPRRTKAQLLQEQQQRASGAGGAAGPSCGGDDAVCGTDAAGGRGSARKRARREAAASAAAAGMGEAGEVGEEAGAGRKAAAQGDSAGDGKGDSAGDGKGDSAGDDKGNSEVAAVAATSESTDALSDLSDDEDLGMYIATKEEAELKGLLWREMNKDWLEKQKLKEAAASADGPQPERRRRAAPKKRAQLNADSATDAARNMLEAKKLSNKINYNVLADMFEGGEGDNGDNGDAVQPGGGAAASARPGGGFDDAALLADVGVSAALQQRAQRRAADAEQNTSRYSRALEEEARRRAGGGGSGAGGGAGGGAGAGGSGGGSASGGGGGGLGGLGGGFLGALTFNRDGSGAGGGSRMRPGGVRARPLGAGGAKR